MVDSVLPYFDPSVQLAGVQYEYNHEQTVSGTSTIRIILYIRTRSGTIISCLLYRCSTGYSIYRLVYRSVADPDSVFLGYPEPDPKKMDRIRNTGSSCTTQF